MSRWFAFSSPAVPWAPPRRADDRQPSQALGALHGVGPPRQHLFHAVAGGNPPHHRHGHVVDREGSLKGVSEGVLADARGGLAHDVELAGVGDPRHLVTHTVAVVPLGAELDLLGTTPTLVGLVELFDVHDPPVGVTDTVVAGGPLDSATARSRVGPGGIEPPTQGL